MIWSTSFPSVSWAWGPCWPLLISYQYSDGKITGTQYIHIDWINEHISWQCLFTQSYVPKPKIAQLLTCPQSPTFKSTFHSDINIAFRLHDLLLSNMVSFQYLVLCSFSYFLVTICLVPVCPNPTHFLTTEHVSTLHSMDWSLPDTQQKPVYSLKFTH